MNVQPHELPPHEFYRILLIDSCIGNGTAAGQWPPHPPLSPTTGERIKVRA